MEKALTSNLSPLSPHLSILLFPSVAHESLMLELGCWLISHLCAHSIDRLPVDCWAGWDSHWECTPSLTVSLPLFSSLSFCFSISQQRQECFNRALMASAPSLTSSTRSLKHTYTHAHCGLEIACWWWKKVLNRKKERELVVLMEDDMPSFSHPQLPSSFCLLAHMTNLPVFYSFGFFLLFFLLSLQHSIYHTYDDLGSFDLPIFLYPSVES